MHLDGKLYELQMHDYGLLYGNSGLQLEETSRVFHSTPCCPRWTQSTKSHFALKEILFDPDALKSK